MTSLKQLPLLQSRRLAAGLCVAWALLLLMLIRPTPTQADGTVSDFTTDGYGVKCRGARSMTNLKTLASGILRIFLPVLLAVILVTLIAGQSAKPNAAYPGPAGTQPTQGSAYPGPVGTQGINSSAVAPTATATKAVGSILSQTEIEARAIEYAQKFGYLRGNPTSVASKEMTVREFNARLDPFSQEPGVDLNSLVWLVVIKGDVVVVADVPTMDGKLSSTQHDNFWVKLSPVGVVSEWGAQTADTEIDFNATPKPITSFPTQVKQ